MYHCALTKQFSVEQNSNATSIRGPGGEKAVEYELRGSYKQHLSTCPGSASSLFFATCWQLIVPSIYWGEMHLKVMIKTQLLVQYIIIFLFVGFLGWCVWCPAPKITTQELYRLKTFRPAEFHFDKISLS